MTMPPAVHSPKSIGSLKHSKLWRSGSNDKELGVAQIATALVLIWCTLGDISHARFIPAPEPGEAWPDCSIVVLGQAVLVNEILAGDLSLKSGVYEIAIEKVYKGIDLKAGERVSFVDLYIATDASLSISEEARYAFFLQTPEDRQRHPLFGSETPDGANFGLQAIRVGEETPLSDLETGIAAIRVYWDSALQDRKRWLLKNLPNPNRFIHHLVELEVLVENISEAIPFYRERLSQMERGLLPETPEESRFGLIVTLRCLGDPGVKDLLVACLTDDREKEKADVLRELDTLRDPSLASVFREWSGHKDEALAVRARVALLNLGEPDGKSLLFQMIRDSKNANARHHAIHTLHHGYSGDFTDAEKSSVRALTQDPDEDVARIARFIAEQW